MESYASEEKTVQCLLDLGFIHVRDNLFDSPKNDKYDLPVVQVAIYRCSGNYFCVDVDGGFMAPIVWDGPKADWDNSNPTQEFEDFLNKEYGVWK